MAMIQFVQNYEDLSTDHGYQFKFYCDRCRNGYMSRFQASVVGMAGSALRVAGDFFGGVLGSAGNSTFEVQRAVGGKGHDDAIAAAVQEGKQYFHQCTRCGKWVCGQVCFNAQVGQCVDCAPNFQQELAASHAHAKSDAAHNQLRQAAQATDYVGGVDMRANAFQQAPPQGPGLAPGMQPQPQGYPQGMQPSQQMAPPQQAPQQMAPQHQAPQFGAAVAGAGCHKCATPLGAFKFCPNCGTPRLAPAACGQCGTPPVPGMKFCGGCGAPLL